jgi:hypothetical protein
MASFAADASSLSDVVCHLIFMPRKSFAASQMRGFAYSSSLFDVTFRQI